jgi:hypothetical protein
MKKLYLIIALAFMLTSCEKVINIDIDSASLKYVVEGQVSTNPAIASEVIISRSKNFSDDNSLDGISGATVTIQEENGSSYTLTETSKGVYRNMSLVGALSKSYNLSVQVNGNTFTATSTMPSKLVTLDTLTVESFVFGSTINKTIRPAYLDPLGILNFYRFTQYKNEKQVRYVWAFDDDITDGKIVTRPFIRPESDLAKGDTVRMEMLCIDPAVYKFWYSLSETATGNGNSAAPSNPVTNIKGGALGVFSAQTYHTRSVIIP